MVAGMWVLHYVSNSALSWGGHVPSPSPLYTSLFLMCKMGRNMPLLKVSHRHLVPTGVSNYYYPIPEGWQAQSQAGWDWGQKLELEAASYLPAYFWFFYSTASPPTPPAPTLIGRCCHDVFKFRTLPPNTQTHIHPHTPRNKSARVGERKVCLITDLPHYKRKREAV